MEPNSTALVSGEGVRLALPSAGVGSRTIASVIDIAIQLVAFFVLVLIDVAAAGNADDAAITAVVIAEAILVLAGYPIVLEWSTRGRTVGKLCMGLRVVRDDGGPIGFRQAATRGLAGMLLEKPGLFGPLTVVAGLTTMSLSTREKRIGDLMAGTVVLNERASPQRLAAPPDWVPVPLQQWVLSLDMHRLDDRLALTLRQFVSRAHGMSPQAQMALGTDLVNRVLAVTSPPPPPGAPIPALLASVLAERRRRAVSAGQPIAQPAAFAPVPPPRTTPRPSPRPTPSGSADHADSPFARPD